MRQLLLLSALLTTNAAATKIGVFDFNQYKDNFGSQVTIVRAPNVNKKEQFIAFACDKDGLSIYYDTGGYPFSASLDVLSTAYKFNKFAVSKTRSWDIGSSHATLFIPEDIKTSFFRQAVKSTDLIFEVVVGPQYGISNTEKFNFKGFAAIASKYLKCAK